MGVVADGRGCEITCLRCGGSGTVPDETAAWLAAGMAMKDDRRSRGNTLRKEAKEREMDPCELSAMETGRIEPKPVC